MKHALTPLQAAQILAQGQLVALPTETVYGLAADAYNDQAVQSIYRLKGRPVINPLIVHYASWDQAQEDALWTPLAQRLSQAFPCGPLTFILPRRPNSHLCDDVCAGLDSMAARVPQNPLFQEVLSHCQNPIAAPSANMSGHLSPTHAEHVRRHFPDLAVLDGGPCAYGLESTIVDVRTSLCRILRPGAVTYAHVRAALGPEYALEAPEYLSLHPQSTPSAHPNRDPFHENQGADPCADSSHIPSPDLHRHAPDSSQESLTPSHIQPPDHAISALENAMPSPSPVILSPGQLLAHYAPHKPLRLNAVHIEADEGLVAFGPPLPGARWIAQLSCEENIEQAAHNLFHALHQLDEGPCRRIAVMPIPMDGIGQAMMDRLGKASLSAPKGPLDQPDS
jgi:tRNA threonylcarbamoyl adenosine modification protein (Sua5/YciO/YrdC/YwlC family)